MAEYVGVKDPMGEDIYNMYVTDERIIRCGMCGNGVVSTVDGEAVVKCWEFDRYMDLRGFCSLAC